MRRQALAHLEKAKESLSEANQIVAIGLTKVAARSAYFAAFHAAEALIVDRTGRVAKTHSGVRSEFARLTRDVPAADRPLMAFLAQAYKFKEISDYAPEDEFSITPEEAGDAIAGAERFLAYVTAVLDGGRLHD